MLHEKLAAYNLILASASPRRKQLLSSLGIEFDVFSGFGTDESFPDNLPVQEVPLYIAKKKSYAFPGAITENVIVITADTIVALGKAILDKPTSPEEAYITLRKLSDTSHHVYTGVYIRSGRMETGFVSDTEVHFGPLSDLEINHYISHYRPFDKAGAYGIQEWIGYVGVEWIKGSFFNVMGLPIHRFYRELENLINLHIDE